MIYIFQNLDNFVMIHRAYQQFNINFLLDWTSWLSRTRPSILFLSTSRTVLSETILSEASSSRSLIWWMIKCYWVRFCIHSNNLAWIYQFLDNNLLKKKKGPIERVKGLTINWKCVTQHCYFCATTVNDYVEHTNGVHNHDPNVEEYYKREGRIQLKEAVSVSDVPLASVNYIFFFV